MQLLPEDTPIKDLPVLEAVLRSFATRRRQHQVEKNLLKSENFQQREQWLACRSKMIRITEETVCGSCNKRIGASAFVYYPVGTMILHYHCHKKMEERNSEKKA